MVNSVIFGSLSMTPYWGVANLHLAVSKMESRNDGSVTWVSAVQFRKAPAWIVFTLLGM